MEPLKLLPGPSCPPLRNRPNDEDDTLKGLTKSCTPLRSRLHMMEDGLMVALVAYSWAQLAAGHLHTQL